MMTIKKIIPKTYFVLAFMLLALTLMSSKCEKNNPKPKELELPPATQTGANTFGCRVNGKVYVPNGNIYYPSIDQPSYHTNDGRFWIRTRNLDDFENGQNEWIYIYIYIKNGVYQTGNYMGFEDNVHPCAENLIDSTFTNGGTTKYAYKYYVDSTAINEIEITRLDLENKIVSGLFTFTCYTAARNDTLKITEGRFDVAGVVVQP